MSLLVVAATERELEGVRAETLVCGIGPVEAAAHTAAALAARRPERLLHVGIAGARELDPPTLVLGSEAIYCDLGGLKVPAVDRVAPDPELLAAARRVLPEALVRPIGTSARLGGATGCEVEAMEGFAVLRAAALAGVPAVELRAISNRTGESDRALWRFDDAFAALAAAVARLIVELGDA